MTAYGYCLEVEDTSRVAFPPQRVAKARGGSSAEADGSPVEEDEDESPVYELGVPVLAGLALAALALGAWLLRRRRRA